MRMKKYFWSAIAVLSLGVTSCKDEVTFDQASYDSLIKKAYPVENVDPNHQWATVGFANAAVTVNGDYGETYKVGIYLTNPMQETTVTKLYEGKVLSGETLNTPVSYPLYQDFVYIGIFDKDGRRVILNAPIENGMINASYGAAKTNNARRATAAEEAIYTKTVEDYLNPAKDQWGNTLNTKKITVEEMKAYGTFTDADIDQQSTLTNVLRYEWNPSKNANDEYYIADGKHFRVASGTTITKVFHVNGSWGVYNDVVIYVEGTMHLNGNTLNGPTIVVADGGEVIIDGDTKCTNAGRFVVLPGGKISGTAGKYWDNSNGSYCYNGGLIDFPGTMNLNGTNFYNNGTVNVDVLTGTAGDTKFTNFGRITARTNSDAATTYNQTWVNGCYVHFTENAGLGSSVMLTGSRFDIDGNCTPMAGTCEMHNQSELKVGGMLMLNGNTFNGPTTAGEYAIVKCDKMYATWTDAIYVNGLVYFDFDPNEIYGMWNSADKNYKRDMSANDYQYSAAAGILNYKIHYWVNENNALNDITIPEGCGGTGFNPNGNNGGEAPQTTSFSYRYCFEDNFPDAGDYDFNDVVLTVTPTLDDRTLTIKVSLDAVGATKTIAAAMRLIGVKSTDLESYTVTQGFASPEGQGLGDYNNIQTSDVFLPEGHETNATSNMVIVLFKDAHWAINPNKASDGGVLRYFWNTVKRDDGYQNKYYADPAIATYTLVFNDAEKAKTMLKENLYDVFIVEPYNGGYWEVHTVQNGFKTAQVFKPTKPAGYAEAYGSNMPWAIMVPGDFQYPIEWHVIGKLKDGELTGAYSTPGHSFAEWAEDSETATDWYLYPDEELVFK